MSNGIRQRLLEDHTLTLPTTVDKARSLEIAQKSAEIYNSNASQPNTFATHIAKTDANKNDSALNEPNSPGSSFG